MKKFAFTLPEIVVSMVVMAIVAAVAIPITKDKLAKVDYATYYLGYRVAQTIATDVLPEIWQQLIDDNNGQQHCVSVIDGVCITKKLFKPTGYKWDPLSCSSLGSTTNAEDNAFKEKYGINYCLNHSSDYWAGAVATCGGIDNIPTEEQALKVVSYLYDNKLIYTGGSLDWECPESSNNGTPTACRNNDKIADLGYNVISSTDSLLLWNSKESYDDAGTFSIEPRHLIVNTSLRDFANIHAFCVAGDIEDNDYTDILQRAMSNTLTISDKNITIVTSVASVQAAAASDTGNFSSLKPHVTLSNGVKIYIGSDYGEIDILNDSVDENDREGFVIYIDVDGNNNRCRLYEDVYPFYLVKSGKIIPAFKDGVKAGANSEESLAFNLHADKFDASGNRLSKLLTANTQGDDDPKSFRAVACTAGYVTSTKYCGVDPKTITVDGINCHTSETADCRIKVKSPIRILN